MIGQYFTIPEYNWEVEVYYGIEKYDISFCINKLRRYTTKVDVYKKCIKTLKTNKKNRGFTYTSYRFNKSVIFIGVPSSTGELLNTIVHEANHLKSHIATYYDLNEKDEEVCYIIGEIAKQMSNTFIKLICNNFLDI